MPMPHQDESHETFMERCIPEVMGEGKEQAQAVAMCSAFWKDRGKDTAALHLDVEIADMPLTMIVANDPMSRTWGLNGVTTLDADGMLFVYDKDEFVPFTADRTQIPLVLAFYDENGDWLGSHELQPGDPGPFWPPCPFRYAVEMPLGRFVSGRLRVQ